MRGKFKNEWHHLRANLLYVGSELRMGMNRVLEPYGMTQQQLNALRIMRGAAPEQLTPNDLRQRLLDRSADTSRLTDRLAASGWIRKFPCVMDKRLTRVALTDAGLEVLKKIDKDAQQLDALLQHVSPEEAAQLNVLLDKIAAAYMALAKDER